MLMQEILFKPLLSWLSDALCSVGGHSVCVVRDDRALDSLLLPCFAPAMTDVTVLDAGAPALSRDVLDYVSGDGGGGDDGGDVLFVTAPALVTAHAVDALRAAHATGGKLLTELLTDDELPTGVYCFARDDAQRVFSYLDNSFDFAAACKSMNADRLPLGEFFVSDGMGGAARVQNPLELHMARRAMQTAVVERHMMSGVSVLDPANTLISAEAVIGRDCTILPGVIIQGATIIGEDCEIGPFSVLSDAIIGDRCVINASQVYDSQMGADARIGPYAYLRPGCTLGSRVKVGDFVEVKNANVGSGSKIPHLSYVGDADVGSGVNIGCGSVTVNYDGHEKHRTTIEEGAFIGCNSNLIAPVTVGKHAYTAAGSTLTGDVPAGALGIARARQENKEGWVSRRLRADARCQKTDTCPAAGGKPGGRAL
jgi:UDP-3-O-[3-hydroxymyristoyl] glucosamine N-acyltransferase